MQSSTTEGSQNQSGSWRFLKQIGWALVLVLALLMFVLAGRYLTLNPDVYFPQQRAVYMAHTTGILLHIVGSMVAIVIGPFQFLPKMRTRRFLRFHRWLGRVYLVGILVGGLGGLYMAFLAHGGLPARLGFGTLAVLWLLTGGMAYRHIRRRQIAGHRRWMVRNYALTFAAVTLRLWQIVFAVGGLDFTVAYVIVAWLSWLPNLLVAESIVRRTRHVGAGVSIASAAG